MVYIKGGFRTQNSGGGYAVNGVKDIYHLLLGRWGREWIVDRLIDLAGHTENSWLEFKASMAPPWKPECYSDGKRAGCPKQVVGDYYLHVVKGLVALANNEYGGILLLGVAEDKTRAGCLYELL